MRPLLPGLAVVLAAGALSLLVAAPLDAVSPLVVAIALGALARNVGALPVSAGPGLAWAARRLLRVGVVLLGLQLSVGAVLDLGGGGLAVISGTVAVTFVATVLLGRVLRVPRVMTLLVATGFAICGAAAVAAMSAVTDPDGEREEDTATAIALVTLFGSVALVALPLLVPVLGFDDRAAGLWIGASVHEVAQVVAAGGAVSVAALAVATVAKLGRVVLLAPLVAVVGVVLRSRGDGVPSARVPGAGRSVDEAPVDGVPGSGVRGGGAAGVARSRPPVLPLFVVGFLAAVALRSTGWLPDAVLDPVQLLTTGLLAVAMVGLGAGVNLRVLVRTGGRAAALGAASTIVAAGTAGLLVAALT